MAKSRKILKLSEQLLVVEKPMVGPEEGKNTACLVCHKLILSGDLWRKVWSPDGAYSVAVHNGCRIGGR